MIQARIRFVFKKGTNRTTRSGTFVGKSLDAISMQIHTYVEAVEDNGWTLVENCVESIRHV